MPEQQGDAAAKWSSRIRQSSNRLKHFAVGIWKPSLILRSTLAVMATIAAAISHPDAFLLLYRWRFEIDAVSSRMIAWNEVALDIIAPRLATSETLLSAAIGLIAGSWVLLLIQKDANVRILSSWIERTMLIASSVALAFSCLSHIRYTDECIATQLRAITKDKLLPHPLDPFVNEYFTAQVFGIVCGALCIGLATVSALWIKDKE